MFVTVVIPARNDARMLEECLKHLAGQTRPADEIVVVDNGSTDDTAAVARAAGARIVEEPIAGIPRASAAGFDAARGELIARIDADSRPPAEWLARVVQAFEQDPGLHLLSGSGYFYDAGPVGRFLGKRVWVGGYHRVVALYLGHPPVFGSNYAMRREVWEEVREEYHRELADIHDDLDMSLHIKPWMTVRYRRDIAVGVSSRPWWSWSALRRRLAWIMPTLRAHWPEDTPRRRWRARREWARSGPASRSRR